MNLEEQLTMYKTEMQIEPKEAQIQETIRKSKAAFLSSEQKQVLSYREFLWIQFKVIRKRWWLLQFVLLFFAGTMLLSSYEDSYIQRGMGVMASIFIILMIPELWKNRSCACIEIESASYYSLRQIYAARMVLFGIVDVSLLTVFCGMATMGLHVEFTRLVVQFLLPMLVTACICFGTLCSKYIVNEVLAIVLCILWCAVWFTATLNERIYGMLTLPVWLTCIGAALLFLLVAVCRILNNCSNCWEVELDEIGI